MGTLYPLLLGKQDGDKKDKTAADDKVKYHCTSVHAVKNVAWTGAQVAWAGLSTLCSIFKACSSIPVQNIEYYYSLMSLGVYVCVPFGLSCHLVFVGYFFVNSGAC